MLQATFLEGVGAVCVGMGRRQRHAVAEWESVSECTCVDKRVGQHGGIGDSVGQCERQCECVRVGERQPHPVGVLICEHQHIWERDAVNWYV